MSTSLNTTPDKLQAVLKLPTSVEKIILKVKTMLKSVTGNATFTSMTARVTAMTANIAALEAAETGIHQKPPTSTIAIRDAALEVVKKDATSFRDDVQVIANATPAKSQSIIESAGLDVKSFPGKKSTSDSATDGNEEGSVDLVAVGGGAREWRYSEDNQTWINAMATSGARATITNLESGKVYYFQNRKILTKGQQSDWSNSVKFRLQ